MNFNHSLMLIISIFSGYLPLFGGLPIKQLPISSAGILPYTTDQSGAPYFLMGEDKEGSGWDAFSTDSLSGETSIDTAIRALVEESGGVLKNYGFDSETLKKKLTGNLAQQGIYRIENYSTSRVVYLIPLRLTNFAQASVIINTFVAIINQENPDADTTPEKNKIGWINVKNLYSTMSAATDLTQPLPAQVVTGEKIFINPLLTATLGVYSYYLYPWNTSLIASLSSGFDAIEKLLARTPTGGTAFGSHYKTAGILPFIKRNNQVLILVKKQQDGTYGALNGTVMPADKWDAITTAARNFVEQYQLKTKDPALTVANISDSITTNGMNLQEIVSTPESPFDTYIYPLKVNGNPLMNSADLVWIPATQFNINASNWQNVRAQGYSDVAPTVQRQVQLSKELTNAILNDLNLSLFYQRPDLHIIKRILNFEPQGK